MQHPARTYSDLPHRAHVFAAALLATAILAAYANALQDGFALDSRGRVLDDPRVATINRHNLGLIVTENYWWPRGYTNLYRPVTTLSYLLNRSVVFDAENAAGYRLVNLLIHFAAACLLYLVTLRLTGQFTVATLTASLWAVHPVLTESVTNIVGRADELAALSVLGALLIYIRSIDATGWRRHLCRAALLLTTLLGLLAKEIAAVIPAVVLLFDVTRLGWRELWGRRRAIAREYLLFVPPLLLVWYGRVLVFAHGGPMESPFLDNPIRGAGFLSGRLTAIKVIGKYLGLLLWPASQSCDYSYNQIPLVNPRMARAEDWEALVALGAISLLAATGVALFRCRHTGFFFLAFSALTLLPVSNLAFPIGTIMAERVLYLPAMGFAATAVLAVCWAAERLRLHSHAAVILLALPIAGLGVRTYVRNLDWYDDETLWAAAVAAAPHSFKTHLGLAEAWLHSNLPGHPLDDSIAETEKALAIVSGLPPEAGGNNVYAQLGELYRRKGESLMLEGHDGNSVPTEAGRIWFGKAVTVLSRGAIIDRAIAATMQRQQLALGKPPDQIAPFGLAPLYASLGLAQIRLGKPRLAVDAFQYQRRLDPGNPAAYRNLSVAQQAAGNADGAKVALLSAYLLANANIDAFDIRKLYGPPEQRGCAVRGGLLPTLNPDCPAVRHDICAALLDVTKSLRAGQATSWARQMRDLAHQRYMCALSPF